MEGRRVGGWEREKVERRMLRRDGERKKKGKGGSW